MPEKFKNTSQIESNKWQNWDYSARFYPMNYPFRLQNIDFVITINNR